MIEKKFAWMRAFIVVLIFLIVVFVLTATEFFGLMGYDEQEIIDLQESLDKAALKYVEDNYEMGLCFYNIPPGVDSDCSRWVEVKTLMDEGYFEDIQEWCTLQDEDGPTRVMVYNYANNFEEEIIVKVEGSDEICK